jgi:AAA domain
VAAENTPAAPPFDAGLLEDVLARPAEPPHRFEDLIASEGGTLVVAARKPGKTTWELNLARSLILGGDFLGRFAVRRITGTGRVPQLRGVSRPARPVGRRSRGAPRLYLVNLRGRRNPFSSDDDRQRLADDLRAHEVESLVTDPFGRAYTGKSQNDPCEVGAWLADLDRWARGDVGATDVVLSAHAGVERGTGPRCVRPRGLGRQCGDPRNASSSPATDPTMA